MVRVPRLGSAWLLSPVILLLAAPGCGSGPLSAEPLTTDEAVRACVVYASCMGGSASACFGVILPSLDNQQARCVAREGKDCVGAARCLGTTLSLGRSCEPDEYSCDGSKQVMCTGAATAYLDCAALPQAGGPTCVMGTSGRPMCGLGSCATSEVACEGDVLTQCLESEGVKLVVMDCAARGMTCTPAGAAASCVGAGPTCTATSQRCEGTVAVTCVGGQEATEDCAAHLVAGTCVATEYTVQCALGDACDPLQFVDTCVGDTLTFCAAGVEQTAQCSDLGFGRCTEGRCQAYPSY